MTPLKEMKRFQPVVDCQTTVTSLCSSDYIEMEGRKAGESSVPPSIAENSQRVRANGISLEICVNLMPIALCVH